MRAGGRRFLGGHVGAQWQAGGNAGSLAAWRPAPMRACAHPSTPPLPRAAKAAARRARVSCLPAASICTLLPPLPLCAVFQPTPLHWAAPSPAPLPAAAAKRARVTCFPAAKTRHPAAAAAAAAAMFRPWPLHSNGLAPCPRPRRLPPSGPAWRCAATPSSTTSSTT